MSELAKPPPSGQAEEAYADYYASVGTEPMSGWDERYEWTIKKFLSDVEGKKVLEIGCGSGGLLERLSNAGSEVWGIDISASGIESCKSRGLPAFLMDVSTARMPFEDSSFDVAVCLETLEHVTNPYWALSEIRRVLTLHGKLICSIPNPKTGHPYLYPGLFDFENFQTFLRQEGFSIDRVELYEWAPREAILPNFLRRYRWARSRWFAGSLRRVFRMLVSSRGQLPHFAAWLWTFECTKLNAGSETIKDQVVQTRPGFKP